MSLVQRSDNAAILSSLPVDPGGVGKSWFLVELDTTEVEPEPGTPPYVPIPGPSKPDRRLRKQRYEDRFPGRFKVVKTVEFRFRGKLRVTEPQRFAGLFDVVETSVQVFSATFDASTLRYQRKQEEELLFLTDDD